MSSLPPDADAEDDDELSELLDSALDDFNKHLTAVGASAPPAAALGVAATAAPTATATSGLASSTGSTPSLDDGRDAQACAVSSSTESAAASSSKATSAATATAAAAATSSAAAKPKQKKKKTSSSSSSSKSPSSSAQAATASSPEADEWVRAFNDELKLAQQEFGSAMQQFSNGDPEFNAQFEQMMKDLEAGASGNGAGGMGMPMPNLFGGLPTGPDANPFASAAAMAGAGSAASASAASPPSAGAGAGGGSLEEQLAQAVSGMQENLKSSADVKANTGEEEFMKLLQQQMAAGGGGGSGSQTPDSLDSSGLIPMMETMMQTLLSPDVLYPSVKELSGKLQDWLVNHGSEESLSADDRTRYSKQLDILRSVCSIYESSDESATDASKKERYETILQLMQQLQEHGHPPDAVMHELAPDMKLDGAGSPLFPGLPPLGGMGMPGMPFAPPADGSQGGEQCCIM
eukprot:scpid57134/ scgid7319/ Peroxisomal biogenesis factor 19; Peroxin-19; Peroxisomal farnesylated protein